LSLSSSCYHSSSSGLISSAYSLFPSSISFYSSGLSSPSSPSSPSYPSPSSSFLNSASSSRMASRLGGYILSNSFKSLILSLKNPLAFISLSKSVILSMSVSNLGTTS